MKTIRSDQYKELIEMIVRQRRSAGLTQESVSRAIGRPQSYMSKIESGERRLDVVEYITLAQAIGFDAADELRRLIRLP